MTVLFVLLALFLMFSTLGKITMLKILQGFLAFIGTFAVFIWAGMLLYVRVNGFN